MKVGIIGASGYSGELLVQLLARHPRVELSVVASRKLAGTPVAEAIPDLSSQNLDLIFSSSDPNELAARKEIDLFFLALPHGVATEFARPLIDAGKVVIDLSADFRLDSTERYAEFYGRDHPDPELLKLSVCIVPETADETWTSANLIACPGCYPTSIQAPLVPLLRDGVIESEGIVINSLSGVSGAGKKAAEQLSSGEGTESIVAYGAPKHRHLSEIEEQLGKAAGGPITVQFTTHLAPMHRGIHTTITVPSGSKTIEELYTCWEKAYLKAPFVISLPTGRFPDTAHVVGNNCIEMSAVHDPRTGNFIIFSVLDNLIKGAGGQAVQIMNLRFGYNETDGLQ